MMLDLHMRKNEEQAALDDAQKALKLVRDAGCKTSEARLLGFLCGQYLKDERMQDAREAGDKALELINEVGSTSEILEILFSLVDLHLQSSNRELAMGIAKEVRTYFQN